jgi:hypothetical protein
VAELRPDALTDAEIYASIDHTVLRVLSPALRDDADWARAAAIQLVGLVRYAAGRGDDRTAERIAEIADIIASIADNELVVWDGDRSQSSVMDAAGRALGAAVGRDDAAADEVRRVLRPTLVRHLDDELAETSPLVGAFRGRLDD